MCIIFCNFAGLFIMLNYTRARKGLYMSRIYINIKITKLCVNFYYLLSLQ